MKNFKTQLKNGLNRILKESVSSPSEFLSIKVSDFIINLMDMKLTKGVYNNVEGKLKEEGFSETDVKRYGKDIFVEILPWDIKTHTTKARLRQGYQYNKKYFDVIVSDHNVVTQGNIVTVIKGWLEGKSMNESKLFADHDERDVFPPRVDIIAYYITKQLFGMIAFRQKDDLPISYILKEAKYSESVISRFEGKDYDEIDLFVSGYEGEWDGYVKHFYNSSRLFKLQENGKRGSFDEVYEQVKEFFEYTFNKIKMRRPEDFE